MAQQLGHLVQLRAGRQMQAGERMAVQVHAAVRDARALEHPRRMPPEVALTERGAHLRREDEPVILPVLASQELPLDQPDAVALEGLAR